MIHLTRLFPMVALVACAQTHSASEGPQAATGANDEVAAATQPAQAGDATSKDEPSGKESDEHVFELRKSKTARHARGVDPSKIKPTKTEAALRLFVVDKDKGPIEGIVISLINEGDEEVARKSDHVLTIPKTHPLLTPIVSVIPMQLLAYHIAVWRGADVDQPRNLAKSVTVE